MQNDRKQKTGSIRVFNEKIITKKKQRRNKPEIIYNCFESGLIECREFADYINFGKPERR